MLYILCGAPGSGKSTWIRKNMENLFNNQKNVVVSRDDIRFSLLAENDEYFSREKEVYNIFVSEIVKNLKLGYNVFADATHINHKSRAKLINAINSLYQDYEICFIFFDVCLAVCLKHNAQRKGRTYVSPQIIERMFYNITVPMVTDFPNCVGVWTVRESV